jgi:hypothetical protein
MEATLNVVFTIKIVQVYQKFTFFVLFKLLFFRLIFDSLRCVVPNLVGDMFLFVNRENGSRTEAACNVLFD